MQDNDLSSSSVTFPSGWRTMLRQSALIGGEWLEASGKDVLAVTDPASDECIGFVPSLPITAVEASVRKAFSALPAWRSRLPQERASALRRWHALILEHRGALAELITAEQGKPIREARGEIDYAASFVLWFAEEAPRHYGETIPSHLRGARLSVHHEAAGVAAVITPWNFPAAMLTRKAAAALAAGCTVVAVPSPETPYSALALAALAEEAGIGGGVLSVLTGDPAVLVPALCTQKEVRVVSFTGSTSVGRLVLAHCASGVKRTSLELGGHAPFIVFPDADIEESVAAAVAAKFQTSGQDCLAANRILVHADHYETFVDRFTAAVSELRIGNGFDETADIGPLIHGRAVAKCAKQVHDAAARGARITTGGHPLAIGRNFYAPTVLADVDATMRICQEETFGPVAALMPFRTEDEAIATANDTEYGLVAYVYTEDFRRAARLSDALEFGMVAVNSVRITGAPIPFGGIKQSGLGREGGRYGLAEFTQIKYVCTAA